MVFVNGFVKLDPNFLIVFNYNLCSITHYCHFHGNRKLRYGDLYAGVPYAIFDDGF